MRTSAGKKITRSEAEDAAQESSLPSTLRPNPAKEWKKAKLKTEDLLALVNNGFLREKEMDLWRTATGDPYPMEKNPDEIPLFTRFVKRGQVLRASDFFKGKWFYISNHHPELPKTTGKQPKHRPWWNTEPTMQDGIQLPKLLKKIKALREVGLRAEHVAFSFMKRRVQPLMARDTLGYQYRGDRDTLRMPDEEVDDDDIVESLGKIFKDMSPYTSCPVPEYSAAHPPSKVVSRDPSLRVLICLM
jgi:hypothetical protein